MPNAVVHFEIPADDVQRAQALAGVVRTTAGLAVDGHEWVEFGIVEDEGLGDPILKAALEGFGFNSAEHPTNAIT